MAIGVLVLIPLGDILGIVGVSLLTRSQKRVWLRGEVLLVATIVDRAINNVLALRLFDGLVKLNPVLMFLLFNLFPPSKIQFTPDVY